MLVNLFDRLKDDNLSVSIVFYSEPGCGKTHMMFASQMRWFMFSTEIEQSLVTFKNVVDIGYYNPLVEVWDVSCMDDYRAGYAYLKANVDKFDGVVFDHLTDFQKYKTREIITKGKERSQPVLTRSEWGILSNSTSAVVENLNRLPIHKVFLVHEKVDKDEEFGTRHMLGKLSGSTFSAVSGMCNASGRLFIKEDKSESGESMYSRLIRFMPSSRFNAKHHGKLLPIEEANIDLVISKMLGEVKTEMDLKEFSDSWMSVPRLKESYKKYTAEIKEREKNEKAVEEKKEETKEETVVKTK